MGRVELSGFGKSRAGFDLCALHVGAVDAARRALKPAIPETGRDGIPLRHELVLELAL